jgi:hypothetical protein
MRGAVITQSVRNYATGWTTGVQYPAEEGKKIFSLPRRPDQIWDPPTLLSNE